jgi:hypothetical protein
MVLSIRTSRIRAGTRQPADSTCTQRLLRSADGGVQKHAGKVCLRLEDAPAFPPPITLNT